MPQTNYHLSVLLSEVVEGLITDQSGIYIDGTFGRGGHSRAILDKLNKNGRLYAFDKDPAAIQFAAQVTDPRFRIIQGSFTEIVKIAKKENIEGKINGILLDLGVSSPQLDDAQRGFSFLRYGPLDMRMDPERGLSVAEWLNKVKEESLTEIIKTYGEERFAKRIARSIIKSRDEKPLTTTTALAEIIKKAHPAWERDKHPATRTFQALRIFINEELTELQAVLPHCLQVLRIGGRLAVISFHSLEDRIVKRFIQQEVEGDPILKELPIRRQETISRLRSIGRATRPSAVELKQNPRARSAVLRIVEKIK
jgi:16S rRNA (cytosine1402-N4)-methyltransferase